MERVTGTALEGAGDLATFDDLTAPYRRELHVHCYRMLGSVADADDLLQETLTAAWRGLPGLADPSKLRPWLYRIATNRCLNAIRAAQRRRPSPEPVPPFAAPEPSRRDNVTWLQPYPDAALDESSGPEASVERRETVELAFVAALQRLPPRQAAVLLLVDVLGFSGADVAGLLQTTPTAVKGLRQRAGATVAKERDGRRAAVAGSPEEQRLARRFADAFIAADIQGVLELLTDDAWLAMPPAPHVYAGRDDIAAFLRTSFEWRRRRAMRVLPIGANRQPGFACYLSEPGGRVASPAGLLVLTVAEDGIAAITRFLDADLFRLFGLPGDAAVTPSR